MAENVKSVAIKTFVRTAVRVTTSFLVRNVLTEITKVIKKK